MKTGELKTKKLKENSILKSFGFKMKLSNKPESTEKNGEHVLTKPIFGQ